jgi:hypothetical protein
MQSLDFKPVKSKTDFRKNYKLHDAAEQLGKNLLIQWGIKFETFGEDKRLEKVWEKGNDKPDLIITYKGKMALLDWKAKHKPVWLANKRAVQSYEKWMKLKNLNALIVFFLFNDNDEFLETRFACIGEHKYQISDEQEWDKNKTIEFCSPLPRFTKAALLKFLK